MTFPPLSADPVRGRHFRVTRPVRVSDTTREGNLRLDALARYLQDVGNDDTAEVGVGDGGVWVARRIHVEFLGQSPKLRDRVELVTFCGGVGSRFAERRTQLWVEDAVAVDTATLWVHLDAHTFRPAAVPTWFLEHYGEACGERSVDHRLRLSALDPHAALVAWPLRATDVDVLDHVNNAVAWMAVEDLWARLALPHRPRRAIVEYLGALNLGDDVAMRYTVDNNRVSMWLVVGDEVRVAALVEH
jgi:acyl-ACP thioesterase